MLYKNTKAIVCSPDGDTDFNIVTGILEGHTLAPYMFMICLDYILQMLIDLIKENGFTLKITRSRWYPTETMTSADFANMPAQIESLLCSLKQAVRGSGHYVITNKVFHVF